MLIKKISTCIAIASLALFGLIANAESPSKAKSSRSSERITGIWRGDVQLLNHNTRFKEPDYYHLGKMAMSVDAYGNVIGRIDNNCAFEGTSSAFGRTTGAVMELKMRRCPDAEFNRKYNATLSKTGDFLMTWQMMDDTFPVIVRVNGLLSIGKK